MNLTTMANRLVLIAIIGQAIAYVLSILLARRLSVIGFEAYVVASAIFILLAAFAPLGTEKYTLRQFPALLARQDWPGARGFLRFGARRTLVAALVAGTITALWTTRHPGETARAILMTCLSLPAGALVHYAVELLSAAGRPLRALAVFRILVPGLALVFAAIAFAVIPVTGAIAIACWGAAWLIALLAMALSLHTALDPRIQTATPRTDTARWRTESRPFLIYRTALALLAQSGIIALELLGPGASAVGAYAAAMATTAMAASLATATNRAYGRELALLLEARDFAAMLRRRRERLLWLAPAIAVFLLVTFAFAPQILALFRPEFAAAGVLPLRVLAAATAFTVLFSLAPTYLKFQRRSSLLYIAVSIAAATQIALLLLLVPRFGAAGAALAYAISVGGMYGSLALVAHREIRRLQPA